MRMLLGRIAAILDYAVVEEHRVQVGRNPAAWAGNLEHSLADPGKIAPTQYHPALHYSEIGGFIAKLREDERLAARCLEFAILTVARTDEARLARWQETDRGQRLWTLPKVRMKVRMKVRGENREDHKVPLSDAAMAVLEGLKGDGESDPTDLIFHAMADNALRRTVKRINPAITTHGFRSTFTDWCSETTNTDKETREFCLAHVPKGTEAAYLRSTSIEKRRIVMQLWADYLARPAGSNVMPLRRTA
jgi:integrase